MKLLAIHNYYRFRGGEDRSVDLQCEVLREHGHKVQLYARDSRELDQAWFGRLLSASFTTLYSKKTYAEIRNLVRIERPDIAHVHNVLPLITISAIHALADFDVPVVVTHHNFRLLCVNGLLFTKGAVCDLCPSTGSVMPAIRHRCIQGRAGPSLAYAGALLLSRRLGTYSRCVDLHLCPSEMLRSQLSVALGPDARLVVLPHFLPDHRHKPVVRSRPYLIYLGRVSSEKGISVLLESAARLPEVDIEVLGDGPMRQSYEASLPVSLKGRVRFHGAIENDTRFEVLAGARALIVPSVCMENLPYSVLEAYRAGVPVIASRIGGLEEVVKDGETGFLFEAGDAVGLARAARAIVEDQSLAVRLGQGARQRYEDCYSVSSGYRRLIANYEGLFSRDEAANA